MNGLVQLLRRMSVRTRMFGAIEMVLSLLAMVGATGVVGGRHVSHLNDLFMVHSIKELHNVGTIRAAMAAVLRHEKDMVIQYEDGVAVLRHREAWAGQLKQAKAQLAQLLEGEEDEDNAAAREAVKRLDAHAAQTERVLQQFLNGAYDNARTADKMLGKAKEVFAQAALNAAVEAARAGEQGRGFAVVASEVRFRLDAHA